MTFHGGDIYRQQIEYDFSVNVNPLGMPSACIEAAKRAVEMASHYPDTEAEALTRAIALSKGVAEDEIIVANGAAELIYMFCHALRPAKVLTVAPAFTEYECAVRAAGGSVIYYNLKECYNRFVLNDSFIDYINDDLDAVILCNPNNPTAELIDSDILIRIADKCEKLGIFFLLDECFMPFVVNNYKYSMIGENGYRKYEHMVVLRAFTKIYAMAGLRLGYALSVNRSLLEGMKSQTQPWNVSVIAQMAGIEALRDDLYLDKTIKLINEEKEYLLTELRKLPIKKLYDTDANFLLFKTDKNLKAKLLEKKILIRSCEDFEALSNEYFRIAIRSHGENIVLIDALNEIYLH